MTTQQILSRDTAATRRLKDTQRLLELAEACKKMETRYYTAQTFTKKGSRLICIRAMAYNRLLNLYRKQVDKITAKL